MTVAYTNSSTQTALHIFPDSRYFWCSCKWWGPVRQATNLGTWTQIYHRKITPNSIFIWQPVIVKAALSVCLQLLPLEAVKKISHFSIFYAKTKYIISKANRGLAFTICSLWRHQEHRPNLLKNSCSRRCTWWQPVPSTVCLYLKNEIECFSSRSDQLLAFFW